MPSSFSYCLAPFGSSRRYGSCGELWSVANFMLFGKHLNPFSAYVMQFPPSFFFIVSKYKIILYIIKTVFLTGFVYFLLLSLIVKQITYFVVFT